MPDSFGAGKKISPGHALGFLGREIQQQAAKIEARFDMTRVHGLAQQGFGADQVILGHELLCLTPVVLCGSGRHPGWEWRKNDYAQIKAEP